MAHKDDDESDSGEVPVVTARRHTTSRGSDELEELDRRIVDLELSRAALMGNGDGDNGRLGRLEGNVRKLQKQAEGSEQFKTQLKAQLVIVIWLAGTAGTIAMHFLDRLLR